MVTVCVCADVALADESFRQTVFVGGILFDSPTSPSTQDHYSSDKGQTIGYRFLYGHLGFGVNWSQFSVSRHGQYPIDYDLDLLEIGVRAELAKTFSRARVGLVPALSLGNESGSKNELEYDPSVPCFGCGGSAIDGRRYVVAGLTAEVAWRAWRRLWFSIGGFGRGLADMTQLNTDTPYAPQLKSAYGGYIGLVLGD